MPAVVVIMDGRVMCMPVPSSAMYIRVLDPLLSITSTAAAPAFSALRTLRTKEQLPRCT